MSKKTSASTKKGQLTRKKIFDVTLELFKTKGYSKTTLVDICKTSGIAIGTFYHYFNSKEDILISYVNEESLELIEFYNSLNKESYIDVTRKIIIWQTNYYLVKGKEFISNLYSIILLSKSEYKSIENYSLKTTLIKCFRHGQETGEFTKSLTPEYMTELSFSLIYSFTTKWSYSQDDINLEKELPDKIDILLNMFMSYKNSANEKDDSC